MRNTKLPFISTILLMAAFSGPSFGQERVFNWLPANDESVRLDPANYHTARTYRPNAPGANNHVDIKAEKPVTIFMTPADDWNQALQHPEAISRLRQVCLREHVVETTYVCELPVEPMTLIIRDERYSPDHAAIAELGAVLDPSNKIEHAVGAGITGITALLTARESAKRQFKSPNDVHIQYYRWDCVENCVQPEYQWTWQVKEKYQLSSFLKVYAGFTPDHDAAQVSIKIKSPVPMVVAMLPSEIAIQLHAKPEMFETALEKNLCQQRGVQSLEFQCTFNQADGPQSLIVVPEDTSRVPHKKAEIEMQFVKCVANCQMLESKR
ncbi:MAG TPA: hypothetical protein VIX11_08635 [Candidatus Acidoferrum sp.]